MDGFNLNDGNKEEMDRLKQEKKELKAEEKRRKSESIKMAPIDMG